MSADPSELASFWIETTDSTAFPSLDGGVEADVAVVGAGIVGITTALLLAEAGRDVALLEADRVACGVSGNTTAKVTSQHGLKYAGLAAGFGPEAARIYGRLNEAALAWMAERAEHGGIDCDFRRLPAFVYGVTDESRSKLEAEVAAAREAGLPASLGGTTELPFPVDLALRFENQADFHVRKYLLGLTEQLIAAGGRVYESSRALKVDQERGRQVVKTGGGRVSAAKVVVATNIPFLDRAVAFTRAHPYRSYAVACEIDGSPPPGMFISADEPIRSIRGIPHAGGELLMIGGEGHKTGTGGDTEKRYRRLEEFARLYWDVLAVRYRWSSQDNVTVDGLPMVGRLTPHSEDVLMATGLAKWGMTGGTAAAIALVELLEGRESPATELFDPWRFTPRASAIKLLKENAEVALHLVGDRVASPGLRTPDGLEPGEGAIVRHRGRKVAAYRDERGVVTAVASACTHLGCQLSWNSAEGSWDCPCHGSRFATDGAVLHGPAVKPLELRRLD